MRNHYQGLGYLAKTGPGVSVARLTLSSAELFSACMFVPKRHRKSYLPHSWVLQLELGTRK